MKNHASLPLFAALALTALVSAAQASTISWNSTITASNPLDWYQFNESPGSATLIDHGSAQLNGTYMPNGDGTGVTQGVPGLIGTATQFDGQTAILNGADLSGAWTAEFVVKCLATGVSQPLMRSANYALKLEQNNSTQQIGYTSYTHDDFIFSPAVFTPINQWADIVYVAQPGTGISLYLDGALLATNVNYIDLPRTQVGQIEPVGGIDALNAVMNEAVLWNRALSASQISTDYAALVAVPEPSTWALLAIGGLALGGLAVFKRRARRAALAVAQP